jgi:hypothetical protein
MGELECAVTGKGFDGLLAPPCDAALLQPVLRRASVWARMSPDNKRDLMELLGAGLQGSAAAAAAGDSGGSSGSSAPPPPPHLGLFVGFCGDGANDCGALKAAHVGECVCVWGGGAGAPFNATQVRALARPLTTTGAVPRPPPHPHTGVSLCEAEASVAAPMTSREQSITSMVAVVAEGRCALLATFQIFQFIVGYAMAQAFATNLMYTHALQMGNYQYLIQARLCWRVLCERVRLRAQALRVHVLVALPRVCGFRRLNTPKCAHPLTPLHHMTPPPQHTHTYRTCSSPPCWRRSWATRAPPRAWRAASPWAACCPGRSCPRCCCSWPS